MSCPFAQFTEKFIGHGMDGDKRKDYVVNKACKKYTKNTQNNNVSQLVVKPQNYCHTYFTAMVYGTCASGMGTA